MHLFWHILKVYGVQKHHVLRLGCAYDTALSISGLLQLILAVWAAGYGSTVRAVRCADLVLPLRPKDDPTDKFDDAVEFVRQFVTFLEVASSARAPWAQGESSRSLLLCLPRSATSKQSVPLMHKKCGWNLATKARKKTDFVQEINNASLINHTLITRCPPSQPLCNLWTSLLDFYVR